MATRAIITSQPDVACDVCGRRLLRGEHPDTYLAGGERRTVCELCAPRAAHEGWLRAADANDLTMRPARRRRGVSLLGRLRQLGEPSGTRAVTRSEPAADRRAEWDASPYDEGTLYGLPDQQIVEREDNPGGEQDETPLPSHVQHAAVDRVRHVALNPAMASAIEVFNGGEQPRRVAGVARSLGEPSITVRPADGGGSRFTIVVAWELCWYRYEVDLDDEHGDAQLLDKGMELEELPAEDRQTNAVADERGELALLG